MGCPTYLSSWCTCRTRPESSRTERAREENVTETHDTRLREAAWSRVLVVLILATVVVMARVDAAGSSRGAKEAQAEIQIGLCSTPEQILQRLDLRPRGAPITVWQFDDSLLTLFESGVRLRLRVAAEGGSELTLKVANQDCARLERGVVPSGEGKCEYDVYGESMSGTVSITRHLDVETTRELVAGRAAPEQVLSQSQVRYLREVARIWPLPTEIRSLGPMRVQTYRTPDKLYDIDVSELPGGTQYAEISRKVPVADALRLKGVMEADLSRAGVETCADQSSQAGNKLRSLLR